MIETHGSCLTSAHYARLGPEERERIHIASLEILERIGIDVYHERARTLLARTGVRTDGIRVRLPEVMVAKALAVVPRRMTLHNRHGQVGIRAWGYNTHYGGGSDCLNILNHRTGE